MAITLVGASGGGNNNGGNCTITLPLGTAQDDLVLVVGGHANTGSAAAGVNSSGYTQLEQQGNGACRLSVNYKIMGGTPDTSVTCKGSGSSQDATAYVVHVFRGVDTSNPIAAVTVDATGNSDHPNSPTIGPITTGTAVITGVIQAADESSFNQPSVYGDKVVVNRTETLPVTTGAAWYTVTFDGFENPSNWSSGTSARWVAATVALTESATPPVDAVASATGTGTASFVGFAIGTQDRALALTGTGTASFVGAAVSANPAPFTMTATANVDFSGAFINGGTLAATLTGTASFVGSTHNMTSVREVVEERGAATVSLGH